RRASLTDPLTGVANRRGFFHTGERLLIRANYARQPTALLMFDLDCFKSINDRFGHQTGDKVLTAFCRLATSQLRPTDLFGRIGGEEFAMLLPDIEEKEALRLAERLRTAFEATSCAVGERALSATVSLAVPISDSANPDLGALLKVADQALYRAKEAGRNCVKLHSSHGIAWSGKRSRNLPSRPTASGRPEIMNTRPDRNGILGGARFPASQRAANNVSVAADAVRRGAAPRISFARPGMMFSMPSIVSIAMTAGRSQAISPCRSSCRSFRFSSS